MATCVLQISADVASDDGLIGIPRLMTQEGTCSWDGKPETVENTTLALQKVENHLHDHSRQSIMPRSTHLRDGEAGVQTLRQVPGEAPCALDMTR